MQIEIFDVISIWKAIREPIILHVSLYLIWVTKPWDMKFCLCMYKGCTYDVKVLVSKYSCKTTNKHYSTFTVTVKWDSTNEINEEID